MNDCQSMFVIRWVLSAAIVITGLAIYEEQRHKQINDSHKALESVVVGIIPKVGELETQAAKTEERLERLEQAAALICE